MMMSVCLYVCSSVRLSVSRLKRVLLLSPVTGCAARIAYVTPPREKMRPREIYVNGGGLLVASINASHLLLTLLTSDDRYSV